MNQNSTANQSNSTPNNVQTDKSNHKQTNGFTDKTDKNDKTDKIDKTDKTTNHNETNGLNKSPTTSSPIVHHINIEKESTVASNDTQTNKDQTPPPATITKNNLYEIPPNATTHGLPPNVFYKVSLDC